MVIVRAMLAVFEGGAVVRPEASQPAAAPRPKRSAVAEASGDIKFAYCTEFIVEKAPDYIFVMDRDAAIGTDGAKLAREIMENELVMGTDAYKNGNIVYLAHPAVWYTAEGGITALDLMLQDLESELLG